MKTTLPAKKLLWIDLEMTGLEPEQDLILEVAALVTDWEFNELARYEAVVGHDVKSVKKLLDANPWWATEAASRDSLLKLIEDGKSEQQIQQELLALIHEHFDDEPAVLAGNSIHQDRRFIRKHWSLIEARLHYRMLDVSSWKIVMEGKYGYEFEKKSVHRAMDDINESIAELKFYLTRLK